MSNTLLHDRLLHDDPQSVERWDSIACILQWMRPFPPEERKRFLARLAECSDAVQGVVIKLLGVLKNPDTTPTERQRCLMTLADALFFNPDETDGAYEMDLAASESYAAAKVPQLAHVVEKMNNQEETFAYRLRDLMDAKKISQQELAARAHCSQPAISQILNRKCRPQKKTIIKLAEALNVNAVDLWPDIEVVDMLEAVASFQQPDYVMTPEEAQALADTSKRNPPKIGAKSLPTRQRKRDRS